MMQIIDDHRCSICGRKNRVGLKAEFNGKIVAEAEVIMYRTALRLKTLQPSIKAPGLLLGIDGILDGKHREVNG